MGLLFDSWWNLILVGWFGVLIFLLDRSVRKLRYFERKNIVHIKYNFKSMIKAVISGVTIEEIFDQIYKWYRNDKYVGFYLGLNPCYLIRDPSLVETLTNGNFIKFHDRWRFGADEEVDPLSANLINLTEDKWRDLRCKLNPAFSESKLQWMFPLMQSCANSLCQKLRKSKMNLDYPLDTKEIFSPYSLASLASCGLGIEPDTVKDPECEFRKMLTRHLKTSPLRKIIKILRRTVPVLSSVFRITPREIEEYFVGLTDKEITRRRNKNVRRSDFLQLLIQLKENGEIKPDCADQVDESTPKPETYYLDWNNGVMCAQALTFLEKGYYQTSKLMSIACYHLSKYPTIQEKVRNQLRAAKKRNGTLNYQALKDVTLLDHCILESLRLFPPRGLITRLCNENFRLDDGLTVEKGSRVIIPVWSLHHDADYWCKPDDYNPERFASADRPPGTYLPFGNGPRTCIGKTFALLQGKVILAKLLENFEIKCDAGCVEPIKPGEWFKSDVTRGIYVRLQAIDLSTV